MQRSGETKRIQNATEVCRAAFFALETLEFGIEEADVEGGVVDHELGAGDELDQLRGDLAELRLVLELRARDAVHGLRALVDVPLGIQIAMEAAAGGAPIDDLEAADLDDAMAALGFEAGGFGVENDLAHARAQPMRSGNSTSAAHRSLNSRARPHARCRAHRNAP